MLLWIDLGHKKPDPDLVEEKQIELIRLHVKNNNFEAAAKVYLELVNKKTLVDKLDSLEQCEHILTALRKIPQQSQEASWLAVVLGDTYAINGKMDKSEELYSIGHYNDEKNESRFRAFIDSQKKRLHPTSKEGEVQEEAKEGQMEEVEVIATAFRISQLIEKG